MKIQIKEGPTLFQLVGAALSGYLAWTTYHSVFWTTIAALLNWYFVAFWILIEYDLVAFLKEANEFLQNMNQVQQ